MTYSWYEYLVAGWTLIAVVVWVGLVIRGIENWFAQKGSPKDSPDIMVQQMFADNVNVNRDPTYPVGEYNPKNIGHREIGR